MKKFEKVFICLIFFISIVSIFAMKSAASSNENYIVVKVDNKETNRFKLTKVDKVYEFNFGTNTGYLEVKNGKVRMQEMNRIICPNAICSDTGWIETSYQSIVCMPNKITVTIKGTEPNDQAVDFVV